jgi:hypothetical protein
MGKDLPPAAPGMLRGTQRASEVVGEGVVKVVRGDRQKVCQIYGEELIATCRDVKTYRQRKEEVKQSR